MSAPTSLFASFRALDSKSRFYFACCATICICSVLHMLPLPVLSRRLIPLYFLSYRVALLCGLLAHGYRLYSDVTKRLEKPDGDAAKASSAPASKAEQFKKVALEMSQSNAFLSSVYCFLFLVGKEVNMVLLPIAVTALFQAMTTASKFASAHPLWESHGQRAFAYLQENMDKAVAVCCMGEVMTGFFLIVHLFTPARQIPRAFVYWNLFLRARYACKDNTVYRIKFTHGSVGEFHRLVRRTDTRCRQKVWQQIGGYSDKVVARVPALEGPRKAAIRWFRGY